MPGRLILRGDRWGDRIGDRDGDATDEDAMGIGCGTAGMDAEIADSVERRRADGERREPAVTGQEFAGSARQVPAQGEEVPSVRGELRGGHSDLMDRVVLSVAVRGIEKAVVE
jgi:hypothetical protein